MESTRTIGEDELWPAPDYRERWRQLLAWLGVCAGERVLDVGFGGGEALRYLSARVGDRGQAVGVTPAMGRATKLREATAKDWWQPAAVGGIAQALPFGAAVFDVALCVNVLEAVPEEQRPLALAELRRVLKPGGRVLVAHDDWESHVYAGADRELTRRCVRAYADVQFASYAAADGQMGRHLWGLFRAVGFRQPELRVLPLVNTEYREPLFGWVHSRIPVELVPAHHGLAQAEVDRWHAELAAASERGEYLFCGTLYVCLGQK